MYICAVDPAAVGDVFLLLGDTLNNKAIEGIRGPSVLVSISWWCDPTVR